MRNCAYIQYPATNIQSDVGRWMLPALSYFFGSDAPENVMLERFWTAKELRLGSAHSHSGRENFQTHRQIYSVFWHDFHDDCSFNRKQKLEYARASGERLGYRGLQGRLVAPRKHYIILVGAKARLNLGFAQIGVSRQFLGGRRNGADEA